MISPYDVGLSRDMLYVPDDRLFRPSHRAARATWACLCQIMRLQKRLIEPADLAVIYFHPRMDFCGLLLPAGSLRYKGLSFWVFVHFCFIYYYYYSSFAFVYRAKCCFIFHVDCSIDQHTVARLTVPLLHGLLALVTRHFPAPSHTLEFIIMLKMSEF